MTNKRQIRGAGGGGKGGGGGSQAVEASDNLRSKQIATIVDAICEGPIVGLVNGAQSLFLNETVLQNRNGSDQVSTGAFQNTDGTFNFVDAGVQWRTGTQDQLPLNGISDVEYAQQVNVQMLSGVPVVRTITNALIDSLRVTISVPTLTSQDMSNGDLNGSSVSFTIEVRPSGGSFVEMVSDTINGKTTTNYQRAYLIKMSGAGPWDVRVTRTTPDSTMSSLQNKTFFDSYSGIIESRLSYPNTALVGMRIDSSQFSSIPTRAYGIKGLIISVPDNYDPIARTYTGIWSGNFKQAWTDNPAWCFYDLLTSTRYGLGDLIPRETVDKWALYSIAQYCDQMVTNGFNNADGTPGMEPRFTCNLYLQTRADAYQVIQNFASIFRAITFWSAGSVLAMQDRPSDHVALYTNGNVIDGAFAYSGTSAKQRHTVALISWNDPHDFYRQKIEYVQDDEGVNQYGVIQTEQTAFGCASRAQANRMGKWLLATEKYATDTVMFKTGLDGCALYPGAIISTSDVMRAGTRMGGRLAISNKSLLTLDADAVIEAGKAYSITVVAADGSLETRPVTNSPGTWRTLTLGTAMTADPLPDAIYILSASDLVPQTWRVIGAMETANGEVEISAIAHYAGLFDDVENNITLQIPQYSSIKSKPAAPTNLTLQVSRYQLAGDLVGLRATLSWHAVAAKYNVRWRRANGAWQTRTVYEPTLDIDGVDYDVYHFVVVAVSSIGRESDASYLDQTLTPTPIVLPDVTGLALEGAFTSSSAKFIWSAVPGGTSYEVQMVVGTPSHTSRTANVGNALRFDYAAGDMVADGGPWRTTTIRVRAHGKFDAVSADWTELTVSNPQIALLNGIQVDGGIKSLIFQCVRPVEADYAGIVVWVGTTADFTPSDANKVYDGPGTVAAFYKLDDGTPLVGGTTYYLKAAGYDDFGKDALNISGSVAATVFSNAPDANTIQADMIKAGVLDISKFAHGIQPIGVVDALPAVAGYTGPTVVTLTTDGQLYSLVGSAWVSKVLSTNVSGQLTDAQIAAVAAAKVTGQLTDAQISAVAAAKVSGQLTDSQIATIAAAKVTGQLSDVQIAAVAAAKVTGKITGTQIADGAISTPQLSAGSVTAAAIAANTITAGQIAANTITAGQVAANAITANEIAAQTITAAQIAANTITAGQVAAQTITAAQIAANTVTAGQIAANTITAGQIAAGAITATEIAAGAVTAAKIAAGSITAAQIVAGTITAAQIAANTITSGQIAANAITTASIAAGAVKAAQIATGEITTDMIYIGAAGGLAGTLIKDGAISTAKLATGAVTSDTILANAITSDKIVASAITTDKIAAGAVTAAQITAGTLSAISANLGNVTAGDLYSVNIHGGTGYPTGAYAWPTNGGIGFVLNSSGLLMGNANLGKYFQINSDGNVYAPGFSIVNGNASFSGNIAGASGTFSGSLTAASVITTGNIQGNAVTQAAGASAGSGDVSVGITCTGGPIQVLAFSNSFVGGQSASASVALSIYRDGILLLSTSSDSYSHNSSASGMILDYPGAGYHTYRAYNSATGAGSTVITVTEFKR